MKLLLVTHYYPAHRGGIEIIAGEIVRRLAGSHEIVWAASDCDPSPDCGAGAVRAAPMRSMNVIERVFGVPLPLWGPRSCIRLCALVHQCDIVHLHDFAYVGNWIAFLAARWFGKPIVITQHVAIVPYRSRVLTFVQKVLHATVGRFILGSADQVVLYSHVVRAHYERFVRFRRPPMMIANGVDTETFAAASPSDRSRARAELGLDPSKPVLLFVGRFVEKKGLSILEELVRRITDMSWVLAGWGPIDPRTWNAPNVRVYGSRKGAELVPLYHAADLLVLPSVGEGLPLVVQESLSCGTPVIVGDDTAAAVNAPPSIVFACRVGEAEERQQTVGEWDARLRSEVRALRAAPQVRSDAAAFARASWSWTSCADRYAALFEQLRGAASRH